MAFSKNTAPWRPERARDPCRRLRLAVAASSVLLAAGAQTFAGRAAVVLSSQARPYQQAQVELSARMTKLDHVTRTLSLTDLAKRPKLPVAGDEVYVAVGTKAAVWLSRALPKNVPLVFCMVSDPNAAGLNNDPRACGIQTSVPLAAQFALVAKALPKARSLGMLRKTPPSANDRLAQEVIRTLPKGWRLQTAAISRHKSVADAIEDLLGRDVDIVWTVPDAAVYNAATVRSLLLGAIRRKKPVFGFSASFVRAGALLGVGIDPRAQGRQAAGIADLVLKAQASGTSTCPAAELPPAQRFPDPEFQVALNLIVARKLSITLPSSLVKRTAWVFGRDEGAKR